MGRIRSEQGIILLLCVFFGGLTLVRVSPWLAGWDTAFSPPTTTSAPITPAPDTATPVVALPVTATARPTVPRSPTLTPVPGVVPTRASLSVPSLTPPRASLIAPIVPTVDRISRMYAVRQGDILTDVAARFGVTVLELMQANHLQNISAIYTDQVLVVPRPTPTAVSRSGGEKRIVVDLADQKLYAFQGTQAVFEFLVSTGRDNGTLTGSYQILDKIPKAYSDLWHFWMPDWMGIYYVEDGAFENGFHALPVLESGQRLWGEALGTPVSYGCVVLAQADADRLYQWAEIGTPVEIRW